MSSTFVRTELLQTYDHDGRAITLVTATWRERPGDPERGVMLCLDDWHDRVPEWALHHIDTIRLGEREAAQPLGEHNAEDQT